VLPLSYRFRTPVIAYSKKYVDAGALASVYFSPDNVAATIADSLLEDSSVDTSNDFSVSLNSSVARSLGIKLVDKEVYREKIKTMEGRLQ
jgi:putative ABC transport system substrate-binding protein